MRSTRFLRARWIHWCSATTSCIKRTTYEKGASADGGTLRHRRRALRVSLGPEALVDDPDDDGFRGLRPVAGVHAGVGARAVHLHPILSGQGLVVADAVVTRDVPDRTLVMGV